MTRTHRSASGPQPVVSQGTLKVHSTLEAGHPATTTGPRDLGAAGRGRALVVVPGSRSKRRRLSRPPSTLTGPAPRAGEGSAEGGAAPAKRSPEG